MERRKCVQLLSEMSHILTEKHEIQLKGITVHSVRYIVIG